jgi:hypothetical protein
MAFEDLGNAFGRNRTGIDAYHTNTVLEAAASERARERHER